jgi:hypothetical protein
MWSLRLNRNNEFYLTYDRDRRYTNKLRGIWELVGSQNSNATYRAVEVNQRAGLLCCNDDEGNVRVLVLED